MREQRRCYFLVLWLLLVTGINAPSPPLTGSSSTSPSPSPAVQQPNPNSNSNVQATSAVTSAADLSTLPSLIQGSCGVSRTMPPIHMLSATMCPHGFGAVGLVGDRLALR